MGRERGNTELPLLYLLLTCFLIGLVTSNMGEGDGEGEGEGEHRVNITVLTFDLFLDWFSYI